MRMRGILVAVACAAVLLQTRAVRAQDVGPALAPLPGSDDRPEATGSINLLCEVDGASFFVDGTLVGQLPQDGAQELPVGEHLLEIKASGYQTSRKTIKLAEGDERTFKVVLIPEHAGSTAPAVDPAVNLPQPQADGGSKPCVEIYSPLICRRLISGGVLTGIGAVHLILAGVLLGITYDHLNQPPPEAPNAGPGVLPFMLGGWMFLGVGALLTSVGVGLIAHGIKLRLKQQSAAALKLIPTFSVAYNEASFSLRGTF